MAVLVSSNACALFLGGFTDLSRSALFGKIVQAAILGNGLYGIKLLNDRAKNDYFFNDIKESLFSLDDKSKELVKSILQIDPDIIFVMQAPVEGVKVNYLMTLQYQDQSSNGKIYLREKIAKLLQSNDEKERYVALAVIAHEYNHCIHGDSDPKLLSRRMVVNYVVVVGILFCMEYIFFMTRALSLSNNLPVSNNGYIYEGFCGFCAAVFKMFVSDLSFKQTKKHMEFRADMIIHKDPVELFKLLCGLESYIDDGKKVDAFVKEHLPKFVYPIFKLVMTITSDHPSEQTRLKKIRERKEQLIRDNPFILEFIKNSK